MEAGRQLAKVIEEWMLSDGKLERVKGLCQLYIRRNVSGSIVLIIVKVTDDFIIGGPEHCILQFLGSLPARFQVGNFFVDRPFVFNGSEISQDNMGSITLSMENYMKSLIGILLAPGRRKELQSRASKAEMSEFRSVCGTLLW